jgi:hypothetical protein
LYLPVLSSCSLVLITSMGCRARASHMPPMDPRESAKQGVWREEGGKGQ